METNETPDWLKQHRDAITQIAVVASQLEKMGNAFELTGNENLANRLEFLVMELESGYAQAETAVHRMINEDFQQSMESMSKTMKALVGERVY